MEPEKNLNLKLGVMSITIKTSVAADMLTEATSVLLFPTQRRQTKPASAAGRMEVGAGREKKQEIKGERA